MERVLTEGEKRKNYVKRMFNNIAYRYDLLNRLLSGGIDIYWRKKAISELRLNTNDLVLDIASGTGDIAFEVAKRNHVSVIASDIAINMVRLGQRKLARRYSKNKVLFLAGDGENLPFISEKFSI